MAVATVLLDLDGVLAERGTIDQEMLAEVGLQDHVCIPLTLLHESTFESTESG
jgi:hypothetical protein